MKLKQTQYKTIEIAEGEEYGMVIGNIVMDGDEMLYAEVVDSTICEQRDLENMRAFLDEVDKAMSTETQNPDEPKASIDKPIYQVAVRCS